ncbi:hypothetical protein F5X98DRAFT_381864 [Xylaria grammica]|nr:hypothetical protein F5X98DRAFT_381864 [Xylaria grammica]
MNMVTPHELQTIWERNSTVPPPIHRRVHKIISNIAKPQPDPPAVIVAVLAVRKAGGAFLPLDPNLALKRIQYMIQAIEAKLIPASQAARELSSQPMAKTIVVDSELSAQLSKNPSVPLPPSGPSSLTAAQAEVQNRGLEYNKDGSLTFHGRKDTQVKICGQRVELGKVEHWVRQCNRRETSGSQSHHSTRRESKYNPPSVSLEARWARTLPVGALASIHGTDDLLLDVVFADYYGKKIGPQGALRNRGQIEPFSLLGNRKDTSLLVSKVSRNDNFDPAVVQDMYPCTRLQEGLISLSSMRVGNYLEQSVLGISPRTIVEDLCTAWENVLYKSGQWDWLVWTIHHAICDGWTANSIKKAVDAALQGGIVDQGPPFQNFISYIKKQDNRGAKKYWKESLADCEWPSFPPLPLSIVQPRTSSKNITAPTFIRAAWSLVIGRVISSAEAVFGAAVSVRNVPIARVEAMIALAFATVLVRVKLKDADTISDYLRAVQQQTISMIPFEQTGLQAISRMSPSCLLAVETPACFNHCS